MKIGVVEFCKVPLVATSQNQLFFPFWALRKWKMHFYVEIQNTLVTKVVGLVKMHISTKNGTMIPNFCYGTCTNQGHLARKPREVLLGSNFFEEF
jgi:hypothetical protein